MKNENVESAIRFMQYPAEANINEFIKDMDAEFVEGLSKGRYIIEDDFDERRKLRILLNARKYYGGGMGLTVLPTEQCNFACPYCYEIGSSSLKKEPITDEVIDAIVEMIKQFRGRNVSVGLYGGEPLLEVDKCEQILAKTMAAAEEKNMQFSSSIITNGYLLTEEIAKMLKAHKLSMAQITLDAPQERHDKRRVLKDGSPTYRKILENIKTASKHIYISIRVNADKDADSDMKVVEEDIAGLDNVSAYYATTCYEHLGDYDSENITRDRIQKLSPESMMHSHQSAHAIGCGALNPYSAVICPDGSILRCLNEVGQGVSYGNITKGDSYGIEGLPLSDKWFDWNPYDKKSQCYDCKVLPSCGGGCPRYGVGADITNCRVTVESYERIAMHHHRKAMQGKNI